MLPNYFKRKETIRKKFDFWFSVNFWGRLRRSFSFRRENAVVYIVEDRKRNVKPTYVRWRVSSNDSLFLSLSTCFTLDDFLSVTRNSSEFNFENARIANVLAARFRPRIGVKLVSKRKKNRKKKKRKMFKRKKDYKKFECTFGMYVSTYIPGVVRTYIRTYRIRIARRCPRIDLKREWNFLLSISIALVERDWVK